ncbi:MAG: CvpA family protein [Phycisphaerales bacterium]|nr:CvpA family protein [Phycisphaerales bacterium]
MAADLQDSPAATWIKVGILVGGAVLLLGALLLGGMVARIFVAVVVLSTWQGLWRGAAEALGVLIGSILAVLLAPAIGRGLEGVIGGMLGTTGMLARILSIGIVGITIILVVGVGAGRIARKLINDRPAWKRWNSMAGAGLGLIEGLILGMSLMWAVLALEPIAANQVAAAEDPLTVDEEGSRIQANPMARRLVRIAGDVHESSLGGLAETTNPIGGSKLLSIMQDFAAISRDPEAVRAFVESDAMRAIADLPSIQRAKELIEQDPQLGSLASAEGVSVSTIRLILESPTLLRILDETRVVEDVTPMAGRLEEAIRQARAKVRDRK